MRKVETDNANKEGKESASSSELQSTPKKQPKLLVEGGVHEPVEENAMT